MKGHRAVFIDRDGVINRVIYHRDIGIIDTPFTVSQFTLLPGAGRAIAKLNRLGLKVVVVSNQPGIAKRHFTRETLGTMTEKMRAALASQGAHLDGIYYCLHHPTAAVPRYRRRCGCRKPKPGLLRLAARELHLDTTRSFMLGDSISDIEAGKAAGCTTILIGDWKCDLCRFMRARNISPDFIARDILDAVHRVEEHAR
jgi:D-glycero-D-manno-heptose 1,7-bisphosphate phosphatase